MAAKVSEVERFLQVDSELKGALPHVSSWYADPESFKRLLVKAQDDGTFLAVAAGYSGDGTPVVCFGSGYSVSGALYGLDRSLQGSNWKPDKFHQNNRGGGKK